MLRIRNRKAAAAIAGLAALGVIGIGSIAYGIFSETSTAQAEGTSAELAPLAVGTGSEAPAVDYAGNETGLWPNVGGNHVAQVNIKVTNPNEVGLTVASSGITGNANFVYGSDQQACGEYLKVSASPILINGPVTIPATTGTTLSVIGVYLEQTAPNACRNKPFKTTWQITGNAL